MTGLSQGRDSQPFTARLGKPSEQPLEFLSSSNELLTPHSSICREGMIPLSTQPWLGSLRGINYAESFHLFLLLLVPNSLLGKPQRCYVPTRAQTGKFSFSHLQKHRFSG